MCGRFFAGVFVAIVTVGVAVDTGVAVGTGVDVGTGVSVIVVID